MFICLEQGSDLHIALLPLTIFCSSKSKLVYLSGFTFLVPAYPGSPGQNPDSRKMVVVVVVVTLLSDMYIM